MLFWLKCEGAAWGDDRGECDSALSRAAEGRWRSVVLVGVASRKQRRTWSSMVELLGKLVGPTAIKRWWIDAKTTLWCREGRDEHRDGGGFRWRRSRWPKKLCGVLEFQNFSFISVEIGAAATKTDRTSGTSASRLKKWDILLFSELINFRIKIILEKSIIII